MDDQLRDFHLHQGRHILFVDDEERSRKAFQRAFGKDYEILLAASATEALEALHQNLSTISVVVTDQRMPKMSGVELLVEIQKIKPDCVRILTTAYADLNVALQAINEGHVYQYVSKPWDTKAVGVLLKRALEHYDLQRQYQRLLNQKLARIQSIILADRAFLLALTAIGPQFRLRNTGVAIQELLHYHSQDLTMMREATPFQSTYHFWTHFYIEQKGMLMEGLQKAYQALMRAVAKGLLPPDQGTSGEVIHFYSLQELTHKIDQLSLESSQEARTGTLFPTDLAHTGYALQVFLEALCNAMSVKKVKARSWIVDDTPALVLRVDSASLKDKTLKLINPINADFIPPKAMDLLAGLLLIYDIGLKVDYGLLDTGYLLILVGDTPKTRHDNDLDFLEQTLANDHFWSGIVHSDHHGGG